MHQTDSGHVTSTTGGCDAKAPICHNCNTTFDGLSIPFQVYFARVSAYNALGYGARRPTDPIDTGATEEGGMQVPYQVSHVFAGVDAVSVDSSLHNFRPPCRSIPSSSAYDGGLCEATQH